MSKIIAASQVKSQPGFGVENMAPQEFAAQPPPTPEPSLKQFEQLHSRLDYNTASLTAQQQELTAQRQEQRQGFAENKSMHAATVRDLGVGFKNMGEIVNRRSKPSLRLTSTTRRISGCNEHIDKLTQCRLS